ncbi:plancitoxin-1-like [Anabas testudineus]|uniref:plancitoxin-1-like n=1 Tax=Anabas testudineus TaxID=64144 RepID=UPI000E454455|nr:plancitoxin-1-like [Anabas testudineus]XP_026209564.1 plancitoxin-1-like [Anabas testudineus]XP_026209565.1 plancitoxin-1-like [Anabas testudineus]
MWRLVLTVSLLCWSSEGKVTCKNNMNDEVDWFIIYKAPNSVKSLYVDSESKTPKTFTDIDDVKDVLANSLQQLFKPIRKMPNNFGFISYSDQPPGSNAACTFGHSKGVVMMEKDKTGLWLLHSTPQFPFRRDQNRFWPKSGNKNAQTFICVTFPYDQFKLIGQHLQDIRAFPFEHDVPEDFHKELQDTVKWEPSPPSPPSPPPPVLKPLTSDGGQTFYSIAKNVVKGPKTGSKRGRDEEGDLYVSIAKSVKSDLNVQTWQCNKDQVASYCDDTYKVYNVRSVKTGSTPGNWKCGNDHSKWCVTTDETKPWTCIADVNRASTQFKRRGGALCINDKEIMNIFKKIVEKREECSGPGKTDVKMDVDSDDDAELCSD